MSAAVESTRVQWRTATVAARALMRRQAASIIVERSLAVFPVAACRSFAPLTSL